MVMSEQEISYTSPLKADLEAIFLSTEKWLNTNCHEGTRATLENLDLTKTHLDRISFSLYEKNLSKAFIVRVNFTGSYLESVKLAGADLKGLLLKVPI